MLTTMIVPECYKDDVESQWKSLKFDAPPSETSEPMANKTDRDDYVPDIYPCAKLHYHAIRGFAPAYARLSIKCLLG